MRQYLDLLRHVYEQAIKKDDRTGVGTVSIFGYQMRFDLAKGFPLVTTKKVYLKAIIHELLWMLSGSTNIKYLVDNGISIWNEWPFQEYLKANGLEGEFPKYSDPWKEKLVWFVEQIKTDDEFAETWGGIGPGYGFQWRNFGYRHEQVPIAFPEIELPGIDQIAWAVNEIRGNPNSRRLIVSAWNPVDVPRMALPPCHCFFQFYVSDGRLSCQMYIRSNDLFLGCPFNIAQYALLTMMVAQVCDLELGELVYTIGDAHIYLNHLDQVEEQLSREPYTLPVMKINPDVKDIFGFKYEDFELVGYEHHPHIKGAVAV